MFPLRKFVAPEFVFGHGAVDLAGQYARNFGARNVLVVTDPGVMAAGWTRRVIDALAASGIPHQLFHDVSPNPRDHEVMAGVEFYHRHGCDVIVAVGGGSPMDCAKGIGIVASNRAHILEFEGVDQVRVPGPPLICIPTTAGTSADVSQFAIINDTTERTKIAIISKTVVPDVALIDPDTTRTMDSYLTACTGLDAMVHAIEAFVSSASGPIMDDHAIEAIRLIHRFLVPVIRSPEDAELRGKMMLASLKAGLAFSNASLGAVHAMAHSLGGFRDLAHGECNSMLIDHVVAYNYEAAPERFDAIARALDIPLGGLTASGRKNALIRTLADLKAGAGIHNTLASRGVKPADISILSRKAVKDPCIVTNPRKPNVRDIEVIYEEAL